MIIINTKNYRDRETGKAQNAGAQREVSEERGTEIISAGYAVEIPSPEKDPPEKDPPKKDPPKKDPPKKDPPKKDPPE